MVVQSANNEHTQGSKCELELAKVVEACNQADEKLVALEQIFLVGEVFSDEHIKEVAAACAVIKAQTESGREKANALKVWFKL